MSDRHQNNQHDPAPYLDPQELADLTSDTRARLANPEAFLITVLRRYWTEATVEEAEAAWRRTVTSHPDYAIDVLNCLHQITEQPPDDLVSLFVDQARVIFLKTEDGRRQPYQAADYRSWLRQLAADWEKIFLAGREL